MIRQHLWNRLERVKQAISIKSIQRPFIIMQPGETIEDLPAKIDRWKAGEQVEGICGEYIGGEVGIGLPFEFVAPDD